MLIIFSSRHLDFNYNHFSQGKGSIRGTEDYPSLSPSLPSSLIIIIINLTFVNILNFIPVLVSGRSGPPRIEPTFSGIKDRTILVFIPLDFRPNKTVI